MKEYKVEIYDNGDRCWYLNDKLHCEDGAAIECADGAKAWYINGKELTEEEFNNRNNVQVTLEDIANKFNIDINELRIKGQ